MLDELDRPMEPVVANAKPMRHDGTGWASRFDNATSLTPVLTPMTVSGLTARGMAEAEKVLAPYGIVPIAGGKLFKTPPGMDTKPTFVAGGPVGVQLASGDVDWTSTGTVTYVDEEQSKLLAFGHSFQGGGQFPLPMCGAYVHTFVASKQRSFKLSSPLALGGTIQQDRQAGIVGEIGEAPVMIPVKVRIRAAGSGRDQTWNFKVAQHPFFAGFIIHNMASGLFEATEEWTTEHTQRMRVSIDIKGYGRFEIADTNAAFGAYSSAGLGLVGTLMNNPFEKLEITNVDYDVQIVHKPSTVTMTGCWLDRTELTAGDTVKVTCEFKREREAPFTHSFDYVVPASITPGEHRITVMNGGATQPNAPTPKDVKGMLAALTEVYRYDNTSLAVVWDQGDTVVEVGDSPFADLPPSAIGTLLPGTGVGGPTATRSTRKSEPIAFTHIARGSKTIALMVREKKAD
jgi:hypothetical protein